MVSSSQKRVCQRRIVSTRRCKAKAGDQTTGRARQQQMEATIAADATAPAFIRHPGQPASSSAFDVAHGHSRRIEDFIEAMGFWERIRQRDAYLGYHAGEVLLMTVELASVWQVWERPAQPTLGVAVKVSLAGKLRLLSKEGQGDHLATGETGLGAGMNRIIQPTRLAQIIDSDIQCDQEGFDIDHE